MRTFNVTVNGKQYAVEVEETGAPAETGHFNHHARDSRQFAPAPPAAITPAPAAAAPATPAAAEIPTGADAIKAPLPGTILSIAAKPGAAIKMGDVIMILEAMKMENEILAPRDGVVESIAVAAGAAVNTGDLLAVLK